MNGTSGSKCPAPLVDAKRTRTGALYDQGNPQRKTGVPSTRAMKLAGPVGPPQTPGPE